MDTVLEPLPTPTDVQNESSSTKNKSLVKRLLGGVIIGGLFGIAMGFGFFIGNVTFEPFDVDLTGLEKVLLFSGFLILLPFAIAIHEGGHLLGGKLAGFQFALFIVGPLMITRRKDDIKFSMNKNFATYGGLAASFPTSTSDIRRGMFMLVAGGPLTSILTGMLFIGLSFLLFPSSGTPESQTFWGLFGRLSLIVMGIASLCIGFVTLLPGKTGGFLTDGARLRLMLKGGPVADRELAVWRITTASMAGARPDEWPSDAIDAAIALQDDSIFEYVSRTLAYTQAMYLSNYSIARQHLMRALSLWNNVPASLQPGLATEAAYFEASARQDASRSREWFTQVGDSPFTDQTTRVRTEAAVLIAEGKLDEAKTKLAEADKTLNTILDAGMAAAQQEWIEQLAARIESESFDQ